MRIFTVHGSPDKEGNSASLLNACIAGMKTVEGVEVESINIYDYEIEPVWKDYFGDVMQKLTDKVKDDMPALRAKMLTADITLLASPIYWYHLSGKMKLFLDRWTDMMNPDWSTELKGKGLALLSTHSGIHLMNSSDLLHLSMTSTADFLGMNWMGAVSGRAHMPWDWDDELSIKQAEHFGAKLAKGINLIGQKVIG
ncbi:flavodoxin family protein [Thermodesulfobacteriota bacterium]